MKSAFLKDYCYYLKIERAMSPNTVASYSSDVEKFLDWLGRPAVSAAPEDVIAYLKTRTELSKRSQARTLSALKSFYKWLVLEGEIEDNPCDNVDPPKLGRYLPAVLSVEEVTAIIESVDTATPGGLRDRAILEILYGCGLRVSEAVGLRASDIFPREKFVRVTGKGNKQRLVPICDSALQAVRDYLAQRPEAAEAQYEDFLFHNLKGRPLSRVSMFNMVKRQALVAGVNKEISPHTFRHSFATHLIENGADIRLVQEMLGHESVLTTEIYTHIDSSTWQSSVLAHHPRR